MTQPRMTAPRSTSRPTLTRSDCARHVRDVVFGAALSDDDPARQLVGIELEWLTATSGHGRLPAAAAARAVEELSPFASGSRLTIEPGGQLELSSAPGLSFDRVCDTTANELFLLDQWCAHRGIELIALGGDPGRRPERILRHPRYAAMERYFDAMGPAGRTMMCNTASIQINVGLGPAEVASDRWRIANRIGPLLIAAFANSPLAARGPTGWVSNRLRAWWSLDPTRSAPVDLIADPADAWFDYALAARVMFIRTAPDVCEPLREPLTFGEWLARGHELGWPTIDDFTEHLTTLFPPVRPRGWFELRMLDALDADTWPVAVALTVALLVDPAAGGMVDEATRATAGAWAVAAEVGLADPGLARSADVCVAAALDALPRLGASAGVCDAVADYAERHVARRRCPADERLDEWHRTGRLLPAGTPCDREPAWAS